MTTLRVCSIREMSIHQFLAGRHSDKGDGVLAASHAASGNDEKKRARDVDESDVCDHFEHRREQEQRTQLRAEMGAMTSAPPASSNATVSGGQDQAPTMIYLN